MIAPGILVGVYLFLLLLNAYDKSGLTKNQFSFLTLSTLSGYLIVVILSVMVLPSEGETILNNRMTLPLLFYFLWLYSSMLLGNNLTGHSGDWMGYNSEIGEWVSQPDD